MLLDMDLMSQEGHAPRVANPAQVDDSGRLATRPMTPRELDDRWFRGMGKARASACEPHSRVRIHAWFGVTVKSR